MSTGHCVLCICYVAAVKQVQRIPFGTLVLVKGVLLGQAGLLALKSSQDTRKLKAALSLSVFWSTFRFFVDKTLKN